MGTETIDHKTHGSLTTQSELLDQLTPKLGPWWKRGLIGATVIALAAITGGLYGFGYIKPTDQHLSIYSGFASEVGQPTEAPPYSFSGSVWIYNSGQRSVAIEGFEVDLLEDNGFAGDSSFSVTGFEIRELIPEPETFDGNDPQPTEPSEPSDAGTESDSEMLSEPADVDPDQSPTPIRSIPPGREAVVHIEFESDCIGFDPEGEFEGRTYSPDAAIIEARFVDPAVWPTSTVRLDFDATVLLADACYSMFSASGG